MSKLSQSYLRSLFTYNPETGDIVKRWNRKRVESRFSNGYIKVCFDDWQDLGHRVAWVIYNGEIPEGMEIDHINHIKHDNRMSNLRLVTKLENAKNTKLKSNNKTGFNGVHLDRSSGKYIAKAKVDCVYVHIGRFSSIEEAIKARSEFNDGVFHENHGLSIDL